MKKLIYVVLVTLAVAVGCGPTVKHPVVHLPTDTASCGDACKRLRDLNCDEGKPLQDGTSCEQFCASTQNSGHALTPSCVVHITKCSDIDELDAFCPAGVQRN